MTKKTPLKTSPSKNVKSLNARVAKAEQKLATATLMKKEKLAARQGYSLKQGNMTRQKRCCIRRSANTLMIVGC
jgi:hypothetical protein